MAKGKSSIPSDALPNNDSAFLSLDPVIVSEPFASPSLNPAIVYTHFAVLKQTLRSNTRYANTRYAAAVKPSGKRATVSEHGEQGPLLSCICRRAHLVFLAEGVRSATNCRGDLRLCVLPQCSRPVLMAVRAFTRGEAPPEDCGGCRKIQHGGGAIILVPCLQAAHHQIDVCTPGGIIHQGRHVALTLPSPCGQLLCPYAGPPAGLCSRARGRSLLPFDLL